MVWALHGLEVYTETADKYYYTIKVHCSTVIAKVSIAVRMVMSYMQIKHPFHTKVYDTSIVTVAYGSVPRIYSVTPSYQVTGHYMGWKFILRLQISTIVRQ